MKLIIIFLSIVITIFAMQAKSQGLGFRSSQTNTIENRTSYNVFANGAPEIHGELNMSFELSILEPNSLGYICTVGEDVSKAIYSLSYFNSGNDKIRYLKLNLEGEKNLLTLPILVSELGKGKWLSIEMHFDVNDNVIRLLINNKQYQCQGEKLNELMLNKLFFGKHKNIIDVPSFAIRNLVISNNRHKFQFTFQESTGNTVFDQEGNPMGKVENPIWLINDAFHWKHRFSGTFKEFEAVTYDHNNNRLLMAGKDSIVFLDMVNNTMEKKPYLNSLPVPVRLGMGFVFNQQLFVYEVNDVAENSPSIASMDLNNLLWKPNSYLTLDKQSHHHNSYLDKETQQFYIFGGFGQQRLSNSFFCYNIANDTWNIPNFEGDTITPRFFAGMVAQNNQLLLFGGVGNETGDQSIGKKYYYDCYQIDIKNHRIKKLWEIERPNTFLVSSRNMVISSDSVSFYTLCYPEYIPKTHVKLHQYNIKTGAFSVLGDSIPVTSEYIRTNVNLYSNTQTKEMYCVVHEILNDTNSAGSGSTVNVYSIDNPPVPAVAYFAPSIRKENNKSFTKWIAFAVLLVLTCIVLLIRILLKRKKRRFAEEPIQKDTHQPTIADKNDRPQKNSMYIFGNFTVFDRKGTNISHLFSPQLKQLFLFILLKGSTKSGGVTSEDIYNSIWPDKPVRNAKNLKGVALNKLRIILEDIDGVEILFDNHKYKVKSCVPFYCDYLEYKLAYQEISNVLNDFNIERIEEITARGQFLKSVDNDFFDIFKKEVSEQIVGIIPLILKQKFTQKNYARTISIASILYYADELNECAFYYILKSNLQLGNKTASKKHYIDYIIRYKKIQGEDYSVPYMETIAKAEKYD